MVTRREKIKRSVCKIQEQIFNLYTKLLEQERVSGMRSALAGPTVGQGFRSLDVLLRKEITTDFLLSIPWKNLRSADLHI